MCPGSARPLSPRAGCARYAALCVAIGATTPPPPLPIRRRGLFLAASRPRNQSRGSGWVGGRRHPRPQCPPGIPSCGMCPVRRAVHCRGRGA
eukprot:scaffold32236_cov124-Isochrysis_galbana.AAC.1